MKKNKMGKIILWIIVGLVFVNTIISYASYKMVINGKKPVFYFKKEKSKNEVTYLEGIYKIIKTENDDTRFVSLKLFFLK